MSIGSASCFKKTRGSDPDIHQLHRSLRRSLSRVHLLCRCWRTQRCRWFWSLEISQVARTQGPAVRQRSEPRGSNGVQGNVGEPIGRANLVAKSPAEANGRAAHARSSFSYAPRIVTARPVAEVDYCSETWSEWQDLNLRPPRPERGALPDCATLRLSAAL